MSGSTYITEGIVLKRQPYRESSILCHCLTECFGRITIIASGSYKEKSLFTGLLEPFNLLNLELYRSTRSDIYNLRNAGLIKSYMQGADFKTSLLIYSACELIMQIDFPTEECCDYFRLLNSFCIYLQQTAYHPYLVFLRFVFRLFILLGIPFHLCCSICKNKNITGYSYGNDGFLCDKCHPLPTTNSFSAIAERNASYGMENGFITLSPETIKIIQNIYALVNSSDIEVSSISITETKQIILQHLTTSFHKTFHLHSLKNYC